MIQFVSSLLISFTETYGARNIIFSRLQYRTDIHKSDLLL